MPPRRKQPTCENCGQAVARGGHDCSYTLEPDSVSDASSSPQIRTRTDAQQPHHPRNGPLTDVAPSNSLGPTRPAGRRLNKRATVSSNSSTSSHSFFGMGPAPALNSPQVIAEPVATPAPPLEIRQVFFSPL
jgi:hypothetical protein